MQLCLAFLHFLKQEISWHRAFQNLGPIVIMGFIINILMVSTKTDAFEFS